MKFFSNLGMLVFLILAIGTNAFAVVNATTYPFTNTSGVALEDMTGATGFTGLTAGNIDDTASAVTPIGFTFSLDGTSYTQFSVNANALMRLGPTAASTAFANSLAGGANDPKVVALWDDLCTSSAAGGGTVQYKLIGSAPNRKLVVEWKNMKNRTATCTSVADNTLTFQVWLNENGRTDFVYGSFGTVTGLTYSTGVATSATNYANVLASAAAGGATATYGTGVNNTQSAIIPAGERYSFIPPGSVSLSSATYSVSEQGPNAVITLNRGGDTSGAASVLLATSDGTATAPADYTAVSTTVNFVANQTSATVNVPIIDDILVEGTENFNVTISNPVGTTLGATTAAVVTIIDYEPLPGGTYTVPGSYSSLTNTGGLFDAVNTAGGLTGPITVNIAADLTGETGAVALNPIPGNPAVLIRPINAPRTISGVAPIAVIRINGADNITINGQVALTVVGGNDAIRGLTVQNLSTSGSSGVIHIGSASEGSNGNTIRNVKVVGALDTVVVTNPITLSGITTGGATPGSVAAFANNNTRIENCSIRTTVFGIASLGVAPATLNTGTVITQNDLTGTANNRIKRVGIYVTNENGTQIDQNSLGGIDNTGESADAVGIAAGTQGIATTTTTTSGGVINALIARNKINGVSQDATFSAAGILVAGITGGTNTIANNMITGVTCDGDGGDLPAGIFVTGVTGSTTRLYYNSVSMTGDRSALLTPATDMYPSFALAINGTDPIVELKNNIFYTTQTATTGGAAAISYAIGEASATFANLDSNYNDFWSTGANDGGFRRVTIANTGGTDDATLAAWQTAVADDANSQEGNPLFKNPANDLHQFTTTNDVLKDKGTPVSILDDFDGEIRSVVGLVGGIPDIGADEPVAPVAATVTLAGQVKTADGKGIRNVTLTLTGGNLSEPITTRTTTFGAYQFGEIQSGQTYILTVNGKRYTFDQPTRIVEVLEDIADADFVSQRAVKSGFV